LRERFEWLLHDLYRDPLAVQLTHDRAVLRVVDGELLLRHAGVCLVRNGDRLRDERLLVAAVFIEVLITLFYDGLDVLVEVVGVARRVHPTGSRVESLIDEELSPRRRTVRV